MRKLMFICLLVIGGTLFAQVEEGTIHSEVFTMLDGTVTLTMEVFVIPYHGISLYISDRNVNMASGGVFEVRKRGDFYIVDGRRFRSLDIGIESTLKDRIESASRRWHNDRNFLWSAFVREGGLILFLNAIKGSIDDEFLNAPPNTRYG